MARVVKQLPDGGGLGHLAGIHDHDLVTEFGNHPQIVGNEDHRHAGLRLQVAYQVQNLGLDGHIQGRGGFVGNQDIGLAGQRHGNHDALAHAP